MKHLKVFQTHEDYLDFTATPEYVLPNVSYCVNPESNDEPAHPAHPDVHYNPQLRITYHVEPEIAQDPAEYNTRSNVAPEPIIPEPAFGPVDIINPNLTLSDYIKDVTFNGQTAPVEEIPVNTMLPVGDNTLLLTLKNVAQISSDMFRNCNQITKVVIPDSVDTINTRAFYGCTELKTIDLGKVTNINNYAFCGCENLSELSRGQIYLINPTALSCEK